MPGPAAAFRNRLAANDECAVAVDGRIVGYQWFCTRPRYVEERYACGIEVPADTVYEYDIFILPEYRLAGLWLNFHCLYLRELMGRLQRQRVVGMVDYGVRLSMNTHLRFGFTLFAASWRSGCSGSQLRGDGDSRGPGLAAALGFGATHAADAPRAS